MKCLPVRCVLIVLLGIAFCRNLQDGGWSKVSLKNKAVQRVVKFVIADASQNSGFCQKAYTVRGAEKKKVESGVRYKIHYLENPKKCSSYSREDISSCNAEVLKQRGTKTLKAVRKACIM